MYKSFRRVKPNITTVCHSNPALQLLSALEGYQSVAGFTTEIAHSCSWVFYVSLTKLTKSNYLMICSPKLAILSGLINIDMKHGKTRPKSAYGIDEPTGSWVMLPEDLGRCGCAFWAHGFGFPGRTSKPGETMKYDVWFTGSTPFHVLFRFLNDDHPARGIAGLLISIQFYFLGVPWVFIQCQERDIFFRICQEGNSNFRSFFHLGRSLAVVGETSWSSRHPFKLLCDDMSLPGNGD